jgi:hypothetical protein
MSDSKMREEFEVWAESRGLDLYCSRKDIYEEMETLWAWSAWKASRTSLPTWQPMDTCPKHVDVLFFQERNGVIPGRLTDADSFMTDKERDEWDGGEEAQFRIDAFGFGHWGVDRMEGSEAPTHWMPCPEGPEAAQ